MSDCSSQELTLFHYNLHFCIFFSAQFYALFINMTHLLLTLCSLMPRCFETLLY